MPNEERTLGRHSALARLAVRQHGVVSTAQLHQLGYARATIVEAMRAGRLHRIHRRVYAVGHRRLTWEGRCLAEVLACAPALASHRSAGWLWGLQRVRPERFQLTATSRRHRRPGFEVHFALLDPEDRAMRSGIPVTSVSRTLLDLAASVSRYQLDRSLQHAEDQRLLDLRSVEMLLSRTTRHPGAPSLRRALDIYRPAPEFTRSGLERRFLKLIRQEGLPQPAVNNFVAGHEVDIYWAAKNVAVELDVFETHGSRRSFETDRERDEDLLLVGIVTVRITESRLRREPDAVMSRLARLLV